MYLRGCCDDKAVLIWGSKHVVVSHQDYLLSLKHISLQRCQTNKHLYIGLYHPLHCHSVSTSLLQPSMPLLMLILIYLLALPTSFNSCLILKKRVFVNYFNSHFFYFLLKTWFITFSCEKFIRCTFTFFCYLQS